MKLNEMIRSVEGYQMPNAGERAVYWPLLDYTDVYSADSFAPSELFKKTEYYGGVELHPEIICPR